MVPCLVRPRVYTRQGRPARRRRANQRPPGLGYRWKVGRYPVTDEEPAVAHRPWLRVAAVPTEAFRPLAGTRLQRLARSDLLDQGQAGLGVGVGVVAEAKLDRVHLQRDREF